MTKLEKLELIKYFIEEAKDINNKKNQYETMLLVNENKEYFEYSYSHNGACCNTIMIHRSKIEERIETLSSLLDSYLNDIIKECKKQREKILKKMQAKKKYYCKLRQQKQNEKIKEEIEKDAEPIAYL